MPRQINPILLERLMHGDLLPLLDYVKTDPELRLEVRNKGEAFVYYKKGKALEIGSLRVNKKYENVPPGDLAKKDPARYFGLIKLSINNWAEERRDRAEFDTQQRIASSNQSVSDRFLIIDMEYEFEQHELEVKDRVDRAGFDLMGVERESGRIILFELKRGLGAWKKGNSDIEKHIGDYETIMRGKNSELFKRNLIRDAKNILKDKIKLGVIDNFEPKKISETLDPDFVILYHHKEWSERRVVNRDVNGRYELIFVSPKEDYKLT